MREIPGHDNTLHKTDKISEKLGGDESGCGGAYEKILRESTAHCNAGPHNRQEEEALDAREEVLHKVQAEVLPHQVEAEAEDQVIYQRQAEEVMDGRNEMNDVDEEEEAETIKMEIMLGMAQEEGPPCLLCLLPRCICHQTLDITQLELKITKLRAAETGQEGQVLGDKGSRAEGSLGGLLDGGGLTNGGINPSREGSPPPQEPAGILEAAERPPEK